MRKRETHSVLGNVMFIFDDEDHVKSRENGGEEVNVGLSLALVPATKDRVSSSKDRTSRVEGCRDPSLRDGDGLLLHSLVDCHSIR